jgi:hypothetical protein
LSPFVHRIEVLHIVTTEREVDKTYENVGCCDEEDTRDLLLALDLRICEISILVYLVFLISLLRYYRLAEVLS